MYPPASPPPASNRMALTSLISGIVAWVLWLLLLAFNWTIGLIFAMATFGISSICTGIAGFLPVIPWAIAVFTGHAGISQIGRTGEEGRGLAIAGLIMGYSGLALTLCSLVLVILAFLGVITLSLVPTPAPYVP